MLSNKRLVLLCSTALTAVFLMGNAAYARDQIKVVGSSTVFPFTTLVAENFAKTTGNKSPVVESTGTGGGFKLFCGGVGEDTPDISDASRAIKDSEKELCAKNGVTQVTEIKIGYDGIVLATSKKVPDLSLTTKDLYLALAKEIPDGKGGFIPNPNKTWKDVNSSLPNEKIEVLGPPPTSGTRDAFVELAMEKGALTFPEMKTLKEQDEKKFAAASHAVREDGAYIEAGENDNLIVQKLSSNPKSVGIFGYSFLEENKDKIKGAKIDGVAPDFSDIASGKYVLSRPLFIYVKDAHLSEVTGLKEFVAEYTTDKAWGEDGYLSDKGLIPMPDAERVKMRKVANDFTPISITK